MTIGRRQRAWLRLSLCRSIGSITWNRWLIELERHGLSPEEFLQMPEHEARPFLRDWSNIERALREETPELDRFERICRQLEQQRIRLIPISHPHYPRRLLRDLGIAAPTCLFVAGNLGRLRGTTVAIVGTRNPSPQGEKTARAYAASLAREGIHVVSGHAIGIDIAAHAGALEAGGSTTLVLARGILEFQPAEPLKDLTTHENTLVVSQFSPDMRGGRDLPVRRNTTIASLADGLIVVECGFISGTSYAFREARRFRKPIWVVIYPEPVPPSAAGNHSLLSAGACPLEPGRDGAERSVSSVVSRLRAEHSIRRERAKWPPSETPEQPDLFES